jgi:hypothetical protein
MIAQVIRLVGWLLWLKPELIKSQVLSAVDDLFNLILAQTLFDLKFLAHALKDLLINGSPNLIIQSLLLNFGLQVLFLNDGSDHAGQFFTGHGLRDVNDFRAGVTPDEMFNELVELIAGTNDTVW